MSNSEATTQSQETQTTSLAHARELLAGDVGTILTSIHEQVLAHADNYRLAVPFGHEVDRILLELIVERLQEEIGY